MNALGKSQLSELFDGELDEAEARALIGAVARNAELAETWALYARIGDHLRNESALETDLAAAVMTRLEEEPVVLAPRNLRPREHHHPLLALAASIAGVAVVGWLALAGRPTTWPEQRLAAAPTTGIDSPWKVGAGGYETVPPGADSPRKVGAGGTASTDRIETVALRGDIRELLLAHQMQASSFRLGDSTEHVRTVAMTAGAGAR